MLQLGVYHHVTGIDASSSASLAAYINTLTYSPHDKQNKVVSGLYWYAALVTVYSHWLIEQLLQCLLSTGYARPSVYSWNGGKLLHR